MSDILSAQLSVRFDVETALALDKLATEAGVSRHHVLHEAAVRGLSLLTAEELRASKPPRGPRR